MLTNVKIYNRFWRDNKVKKLSSNGKYLFGYMISSPYNNELGLYYMPLTLIAHDTGLAESVVKTEIANLVKASLIKYDFKNEMVFVTNFLRFNKQSESVTVKEVETILENLPETYLVKDFLESIESNNVSYINAETISGWKENFQPVVRGLAMKETVVEIPVKEKSVVDELVVNEPTASSVTENIEKEKELPTEEPLEEKQDEVEEKQDSIEKPKKKAKKEKDELDLAFDEIASVYPNHKGITNGRKYFKKLVNDETATVFELKNAVNNYLKYIEEKNIEPEYIIAISNFFGKHERYIEYMDSTIAKEEETISEEEEQQVKVAFEKFWQAYPKKEGKELAYKNFLSIYVNKENTLEELISSAEKYANDCFVKHKENQFIKKASSFLDLETRPYRDFLNFTTSSIVANPTEDYVTPVINQPIFDAPVPPQELDSEESIPPMPLPSVNKSSIIPQPLDDEDEYSYPSFETSENEDNSSVSSTFVSNENDEETDTPW